MSPRVQKRKREAVAQGATPVAPYNYYSSWYNKDFWATVWSWTRTESFIYGAYAVPDELPGSPDSFVFDCEAKSCTEGVNSTQRSNKPVDNSVSVSAS